VFEHARVAYLPQFLRDRGVPNGGRLLLPYQTTAVARHLHVQNSGGFLRPRLRKDYRSACLLGTCAQGYSKSWSMGRRATELLSALEDEFEACFGRPSPAIRVQGSAHQRERILREAHNSEMLLSSYHSVWRDSFLVIQALERRPWLVVLDEAHYVKSMHGALATAVREIAPHAARRMVLTGTPMPRSPRTSGRRLRSYGQAKHSWEVATEHALRCRQPAEWSLDSSGHNLSHSSPYLQRMTSDCLPLRIYILSSRRRNSRAVSDFSCDS